MATAEAPPFVSGFENWDMFPSALFISEISGTTILAFATAEGCCRKVTELLHCTPAAATYLSGEASAFDEDPR
jgi:hypothetical protein